MSFIAGYVGVQAAMAARDAAKRGEDPVQGAVDGAVSAGKDFAWLGGFLIWMFLAMIMNGVLIGMGMPSQSMPVFLLGAFLVVVLVVVPTMLWCLVRNWWSRRAAGTY